MNDFKAASQLAQGVIYKASLPTIWRCPRHILNKGIEVWNKTRINWYILVEGDDVPPPMEKNKSQSTGMI